MRTRNFGKDGLQVSEVGLGTWQLGADWGSVDEKTARQILEKALELGVTFFDTADVYGLGLSEKRIGAFLRESGAKVTVATKLGRFPQPGWPENFKADAIRKHTVASLERLGVESLDLTQLHCIPTDVLRQGEVFESLRTLQKEGKIKRFGVSVESMEEALICLQQPGLASLQIIFNIFRQKPIDTLFAEAKTKGVALIVRLPLASGLLSGRMQADQKFPAEDHRNYNRDGDKFNVGETFAGLEFPLGVSLANEVKSILPQTTPMAQQAIRWCLDFDAVTTVIPGATKVEQVVSNCAAAGLPRLSEDVHRKLREMYSQKVAKKIRGPY
jgi:aryl-alcohol dehydrogenase-like predicted oxidoreductase